MTTPKPPITNAESKGRNAPMTEARLEEIESAASKGGTMSKERLAAIKERCEKATPGEWKEWIFRASDPRWIKADSGQTIADGLSTENADFVAHARTDIPDLVAALEAAWAETKTFKEAYLALHKEEVEE